MLPKRICFGRSAFCSRNVELRIEEDGSAPGFRAPEQMTNDRDRQDTRTDIFSLGITMFATMTGVHPFDIDGMDLQEAIHAGTHRSLSEHFPNPDSDAVAELEWYVHKMIETKMHRRFRTPEMALEELERVMEEIA